jgi:hypothetical protein
VLVNPTGQARAVRVPAGYRNRSGDRVRVVRLAPATGMVLTGVRR